jgi:hypothetical protein
VSEEREMLRPAVAAWEAPLLRAVALLLLILTLVLAVRSV